MIEVHPNRTKNSLQDVLDKTCHEVPREQCHQVSRKVEPLRRVVATRNRIDQDLKMKN